MSEGARKKVRSPSYPAIDLEQAVSRARELLERENRHWVPVDTALEAWGYSPASGLGLLHLAALKKFGLLEDSGSGNERKVRLTNQAHDIVIDERDESAERAALLREAALRPRIHADLWTRYGAELPSDSTIRFELRRMGFSEDASSKLIAEWRRTFEFAGLASEAAGTADVDQVDDLEPDAEPAPPATSVVAAPPVALAAAVTNVSGPGQPVQLPLSHDKWATLIAPFPLSEGEWAQMVAVLTAMKPALVASEGQGSET